MVHGLSVCVCAQVCGRVPGAAGSLHCKSQAGLREAAEVRPTACVAEVSRTQTPQRDVYITHFRHGAYFG